MVISSSHKKVKICRHYGRLHQLGGFWGSHGGARAAGGKPSGTSCHALAFTNASASPYSTGLTAKQCPPQGGLAEVRMKDEIKAKVRSLKYEIKYRVFQSSSLTLSWSFSPKSSYTRGATIDLCL